MKLEPALTYSFGGELPIARIGYGAMRLTGQPGNFGRYADWEGGKAVLRRAVELGVDFIDTARAYGPGHNEELIAEALDPYPAGLVIATKGGVDKGPGGRIEVDASPATLTRQIDEALVRLKVERIDLFQLHRVDPAVPIAESVGAIDAARRAGKVRLIGVSNVDYAQLASAMSVAKIASVQNRLNEAEQDESDLVDFAAANDIAFIPYSPLGAHPMRPGAALDPASALRWLLERSPNIVVIPGTTSIAHLEDNMRALTRVQ